MNTLPELKEEELRSFFQEHLNDVVGQGVRSHDCPITRFYRERYGMSVTTTRQHITFYPLEERSQYRMNDPWVASFTTFIDWYCGHNYVTGQECLKALDKALGVGS